jgi:hypothetical protein
MLARKHAMLAHELEREQDTMPDLDASLDDDIGDEMLRLIFTACHPLLSRDASAALALRMICGLTTEEIARAFLVERRLSVSASCAPSARCRTRGWLTKPRAASSCRSGSLRCWRWSI